MLNLHIVGQDTLAAAVRECCARHFSVTTDLEGDEDLLWVCYDTPIGTADEPVVSWVLDRIDALMPLVGHRTLIMVSSQVPVGTTAILEKRHPNHKFAYSPENIRVKTAVEDFQNQARVVVGIRGQEYNGLLQDLFTPFTENLILTDPETAEMVKHALNCWLGMNIAFINEIARICQAVGADSGAVSKALLLERRISPYAPLKPGAPFGLGHLARDIYNLTKVARENRIMIPIISHIRESNES